MIEIKNENGKFIYPKDFPTSPIDVFMEVKYNGLRALLIKKGDTIKVMVAGVQYHFLKIENTALKIPYDFTFDCVLVKNKKLRRLDAHKVDDVDTACVVFDILEFNGVDISKRTYRERKDILNAIDLGNAELMRVKARAAAAKVQIKDFYDKVIADGGDGIIIKEGKSTYSKKWYKIEKEKLWF